MADEELLLKLKVANADRAARDVQSVADAATSLGDTVSSSADDVDRLTSAQDDLARSSSDAADAAGDAQEKTESLADTTSEAGSIAEDTKDKSEELASAHKDVGDAAADTTDKTKDLSDAHEENAEAADDAARGQGRYRSALALARKTAVAATGAVAALSLTLSAGKDQISALTLSSNTFGKTGSNRIEAFGKQAADSLGLSETAAVKSATSYGTLLTGFDVGKRKASVMGRELVGLSVDLAKFKGVSVDTATQALLSGFAGKGAQLKKLGVNLDQNAVKEEALRRGYIKTTKDALTPQAKAMATYGLIMQRTSAAQGAFSRSQGKAGTEVTKAKAKIANMRAEIGTRLVPIVNQLTIYVAKGAQWLIAFANNAQKVAGAVAAAWRFTKDWAPVLGEVALGVALLNRNVIISNVQFGLWAIKYAVVTTATSALATAQAALNFVMSANPLGILIIALTAVAVGFTILYKKSETFRKAIGSAFQWLKTAAANTIGWVKAHWPLILSILTGPIGAAVIYIARHWDQVVASVKALPGRIAKAASGMWDGIKESFKSAVNWIIRKWNNLSFHIGGTDLGPFGHLPSVTLNTPDIPTLYTGGEIKRGGMAVVGERGPELVSLPGRSMVYDAEQSARAMRGGTDRVSRVHVTWKLDGGTHAQRMAAQAMTKAFKVEVAHA